MSHLRAVPPRGGSHNPAMPFCYDAPSNTPGSLFRSSMTAYSSSPRYLHNTEPDILIYTDGACSNNGRSNAIAGCGFVVCDSTYNHTTGEQIIGFHGFRLEARGPTGELYHPTSNRAELRAAIAAISFRRWHQEA